MMASKGRKVCFLRARLLKVNPEEHKLEFVSIQEEVIASRNTS